MRLIIGLEVIAIDKAIEKIKKIKRFIDRKAKFLPELNFFVAYCYYNSEGSDFLASSINRKEQQITELMTEVIEIAKENDILYFLILMSCQKEITFCSRLLDIIKTQGEAIEIRFPLYNDDEEILYVIIKGKKVATSSEFKHGIEKEKRVKIKFPSGDEIKCIVEGLNEEKFFIKRYFRF